MTEGDGRLRLVSLDTFRGLTIAAMILVNNPGSWAYIYAPFRHAPWHGWTPTDWIFPFFLFIMGVAMAISFQRRRSEEVGPGAMWLTVLKRSALLFGLGLILTGYPRFDLATIRIMSVLQRIAVVYLILSAVVLSLPRKRNQWLVMGGFIALYLGIMYGLDVPGHGRGMLTPEGNAAGYIDRLVLGKAHLWSGTRAAGYDPEGLVSTLPAILSGYLGWVFGQILVNAKEHGETLRRWLFWGVGLTVIGWLLGLAMPINKQLWTPSYAIFMSGLGGLALALCYWIIEVKHLVGWSRPFVMMGMNPLLVFWLSGFLVRNLTLLKFESGGSTVSAWAWLYQAGFASWLPAYPASWAFALANVVFWLVVAWILYRRRIFIKL